MYIVRRVTSPMFGSSRNVAITNSPSGKSSIGPSIDFVLVVVTVRERRQHGEAEHRQRDQAADQAAEAERDDGEEGVARVLRRALILLGVIAT